MFSTGSVASPFPPIFGGSVPHTSILFVLGGSALSREKENLMFGFFGAACSCCLVRSLGS